MIPAMGAIGKRMGLRRREDVRRRGADRVTLGLAGLALATTGTVFIGELARLVRRRGKEAELPAGVIDTAGQAIAIAGAGAQDTVTVAIEAYDAAPRHETVLFNLLGGFAASFAIVRLSTHGMRGGWWPFGAVELGGRHIHHFVPGILVAFASGAWALLTSNEDRETMLAIPFGAGVGLTFDEAAMLLELEDVYWTPEGVLSVQISLGLAAILGSTIVGLRMLRRGERRVEQAGLIPAPP
jgi:hypothetical protein